MIKKILIVLSAVLLILMVYLYTQGLFASIEVVEQPMSGYRVMGIEHRGPYEKIGDAFNRIHTIADDHHVPVRMIGVYFDNPNEVAEDSLRSLAGVIVSVEDSLRLAAIPELTSLIIPAGNAAVSNFETDDMVSMIIGAMKSYPKLTEYVAAKNKGQEVNFVYEVYGEGQTQYVMQFQE
ncbi:MAG: GyrI-like domain-containing protein [Flavobacteriales bacterium]|jgi:DNA gyrase inhibitor GyrI